MGLVVAWKPLFGLHQSNRFLACAKLGLFPVRDLQTVDHIQDHHHIICSISCRRISDFTEAARLLFMASLHSHKMSYQTWSIEIFVDLPPFGCNFKGGLFDAPVWGEGPSPTPHVLLISKPEGAKSLPFKFQPTGCRLMKISIEPH